MRRFGRKPVMAAACVGILLTAGAAFAKTSTYPVARGNWERANVGASKSTLASGSLFGRELTWRVGADDAASSAATGTPRSAGSPATGRRRPRLEHRDIHTNKGSTYRFSLKLAGEPDCGPTIKRVEVFWDGQSLHKTFDISGTSTAHRHEVAEPQLLPSPRTARRASSSRASPPARAAR